MKGNSEIAHNADGQCCQIGPDFPPNMAQSGNTAVGSIEDIDVPRMPGGYQAWMCFLLKRLRTSWLS